LWEENAAERKDKKARNAQREGTIWGEGRKDVESEGKPGRGDKGGEVIKENYKNTIV